MTARPIAMFVVLAFVACGSGGGSGEDVPDALARLAGEEGTLVVLRDTADFYYALPAAGFRHVAGRTAAIEVGVDVAGGSGDGPPQAVAETLLEQRAGGGPFFMAMNVVDGDSVQITGQVGRTTEELTIEVEEMVLSRPE